MVSDTGLSATLELLNSGAEEVDKLQVNDISNGFLYNDAFQPAYQVVDGIVERVVIDKNSRLREKGKKAKGTTTRIRDSALKRQQLCHINLNAESLLNLLSIFESHMKARYGWTRCITVTTCSSP